MTAGEIAQSTDKGLVEAASIDEAIAVASGIPGTENRAIEVREVAIFSGA